MHFSLTRLTDEEFIEQEFTEEFYKNKLHIKNWRELLNGPRRVDIPKTAWKDLQFLTPSGKIELYSLAEKNKSFTVRIEMIGIMNIRISLYILLNHEPFRINSQFQCLLL